MSSRIRHTQFRWLCLFLAAVPLFFPIYWNLQRFSVKMEMLEKLEKKSLQKIQVRKDQIQWIKTEKECLIQGKYFDVWEVSYRKDEVILTGLYDEQEDKLSLLAERQLNHKPAGPHPLQFLKYISSDQKNSGNFWYLEAISLLTGSRKPDQNTSTLTGYSLLFSPPPEF